MSVRARRQQRSIVVRAILLFTLTAAIAGAIAVSGLGVIAFFLTPFVAFLWIAVEVLRHGVPGEAVLRTAHGQFLGPGGLDDPFATEDLDEGERRPVGRGN
jgi:hypothetical protein